MGSHIDGFVATAAHTVVVQSDAEAPITGKAADVVAAANTALEAAIRLIRPGKRILEVQLGSYLAELFTSLRKCGDSWEA